MLIGILQTGHAPDGLRARHGDYDDMFARLLAGRGLSFRTWRVVDGELPEGVHAAEGWLITGSRHGAYEDHPWIAPLEAFIRSAGTAGVPMVGICFGHQIMAQALGGTVEKYSGGWAVGPQSYAIEGEMLSLNAWHQDQVTAPPPEGRVIATNDFCRYAGFAFGAWGLSLQAHPEFDDAFIEGLIETRGRGLVPDVQLDAAAARLGGDIATGRAADRIAAFLQDHRGRS
ncbi:glutamine amidotransferase [Rhodobacteraceae bacterium WD3A24]|nr:glutamine amidotransferase [Rhodobacteraceae bacterium WD3A24]